MTINIADNSPRISYSVAEGVTQTSFAVPFEFFDDPDLNVYLDGTLQTITTNYTVAGGDGSTGTVTMSVTGASGGSTVVITRDIELERTTDFPVSGAFNIVALNTELDRLVAIAADLEDRAARAIQAQDFDSTVSYTLPVVDDRKGKVLGFNATTGAVEAGPEIANVQSLANISADIALLADIEDGTLDTNAITNVNGIRTNVTTVAGISSDVTTVAGINSSVTTVASNNTNVSTVASNIASVNTVASNIADVITVANDLNEAISEVETVANDLNEAVSEIDTVASSITNVDIVGNAITNVNTVATDLSGSNTVGIVATNITNVNTVAGISGNVTTVAGISADVTTVAADGTDIGTVATNIANVNTVAGISGNVTTVAGVSANVTTVAGISADVTAVAGDASDIGVVATNIGGINTIGTVATNITNVNNVGANITNINTVAGAETNINTVATNLGGTNTIGTVAGSIANVNLVGGSIADVNTVASNLTDVQSFANTYRIGSTDPTTSLDTGDLFYNTTSSTLKVYTGSAWEQGVTAGSGFLPLTGGTLTGDLSGTNLTLSGYLRGPSTFTIDPAAHGDNTGTLVIAGNLQVDGTTTTINSTTLTVDDLNITLASGAANAAAADGAGLTVDGASATLTYNSTPDAWSFNKNVGIGVVPETWASNHKALQLGGTFNAISGPNLSLLNNAYWDTSGAFKYTTTSSASRYYQAAGQHMWFSAPSGTAGANISFSEQARIDASGNLLVGTSDTDLTNNSGTATGAALKSNGLISSATNNTSSLELNRLSSDGNIANFRRSGTLVGSIETRNGTHAMFVSNGAGSLKSNSTEVIRWLDTTGVYPVTNNTFDLGTSSLEFKDAHFAGTVNAANFNSTSDATLKTNVETLSGSLDAVMSMRGVSFDWIENGNPEIGVIAQEVEEVLPELVNTNDNGIKSVKYGNIVAVLIEAIKEQQEQINELKAQLNS